MRAIKDSVHDYIEVEGVAADLIDTPAVQRLRRVRQLSTVRLVYPSANHTRFEHSLGVYHLARAAADRLDLPDEEAGRVHAAALLHDVGHGPYGHQTEGVIERRLGRHHDDVADLLAASEAGDVLRDHGLVPGRIASLVAGEGRYGPLISGPLDVDRMDYLVRDAHHTGVPYGTIDHGRLLRALRVVDGELVVGEGDVPTAESALIARTLMNATVYRHHVSRIAGAMLDRAAEGLLDTGTLEPERFARLTDDELMAALAAHEATATFARRLRERDLYKRALWIGWEGTPDRLIGVDHDGTRELERTIADAAGCPPEAVILDAPGRPAMPESGARVVVDGEVEPLTAASTLVAGLDACQRERWRLGVYAPDECTDRVGEAAGRVLGIETADPGGPAGA